MKTRYSVDIQLLFVFGSYREVIKNVCHLCRYHVSSILILVLIISRVSL